MVSTQSVCETSAIAAPGSGSPPYASGKITVKVTTGDVELEACDGGELFLKATTGDVEGTLLTPKTFEANATTGKVDVPNPSTGGLCKIKTTTGDIQIRIR